MPAALTALQTEKKRLRRLLRQRRRDVTPSDVAQKSQRVCRRLCAHDFFQSAQTVVLYSPHENEIETDGIWQVAREQGKVVYYPRIPPDKRDLEFVRRYDEDQLTPGIFDICIPPGNDILERVGERAIVLTPGVGFDRFGHRLGRGRGYYDRAFCGILAGAIRIGLAYDFQLVPQVPTDTQDALLDYIITETQLSECSGRNSHRILA